MFLGTCWLPSVDPELMARCPVTDSVLGGSPLCSQSNSSICPWSTAVMESKSQARNTCASILGGLVLGAVTSECSFAGAAGDDATVWAPGLGPSG